MKPFLIIILSSFVFITSQAQEDKKDTINNIVETSWPKDIDGLIEHLNNWNKDQLDAYERPEAYPNFITNGETNGWISEHKRLLKNLGATVIWNKEKLKYELMKH